MNRAERRAADRERQKLKKELDKLSPNQLRLVDRIIDGKVNEVLSLYKELVTSAIYKSMRENRVGEERTQRILEETDRQLREWLKEEKKVS